MTREEAMQIVQKLLKTNRLDGTGLSQVWDFLKQPVTLADLLGWEEGVEYELEDRFYTMEFLDLDLPTHYKMKVKLSSDSLEFNWKGGNLKTRSLQSVIDELKQAKKVEKKLKAYHVKDEYSYNCLMKELEEQGRDMNFKNNPFAFEGEIYIFEEENRELGFSIIKLNKVLEKYDLIEYHKEGPLYYARFDKIENIVEGYNYWILDTERFKVLLGDSEHSEDYKTIFTKTKWNELGINDTNAVFEEVTE